MTVAMGANKHSAARGWTLQVESAASEMQRVKIHLRKNLQNQANACMKKQFAAINSLQN